MARLWVCRGLDDAHDVAIAVVGGGPDALRQLFFHGANTLPAESVRLRLEC